MKNRFNISNTRGVLSLVGAIALLTATISMSPSLPLEYAGGIGGMFLWLYGIDRIALPPAFSLLKRGGILAGLVFLYPILALIMHFIFPSETDLFHAKFKWGSLSSLHVFLFEIAVLWLVAKVYRIDIRLSTKATGREVRWWSTLAYLTFFLAANVLLQWTLGLQFHTAFLYDLTDINRFQIGQFMLFGHLFLALATLFLVGHKLTKLLQSLSPNLKERIKHLGLAALIWAPVGWVLHPGLPFGIIYLGVFIFTLLMDLYGEKPANGYVWLIIWLIFFSSVASATMLQSTHYLAKATSSSQSIEPEELGQKYANYIYLEKGKIKEKKGIFTQSLRLSNLSGRQKIGKYSLQKVSQNNRTLLFAYPAPGITNGISLFSLFFIFMLVTVVLLALVNSVLHFLPEAIRLHIRLRSSLQERIQIIIISTIIVSFVIIGYASVYFFRQRTHNILNNATAKDLHYIQLLLKSSPGKALHPDWQHQYIRPLGYAVDEMNKEETGEKYKEGMKWLTKGHKDLFWITAPGSGNIMGALIPSNKKGHFYRIEKTGSHAPTLSQGVLTNLINVYVFLFLIAYAIVIAMSGSITWPLKVLGERLREIRLNRKNETLEWPDNDEIGQLINNYNLMLAKLHESAEVLAKTERDNAWREMAKQVAHEIKTPLTPMKLSIQYLKMTADNHSGNLDEMVRKVANTLIEQIDNLSSIATEFSNFAKMPNANNQKTVLNDVVVSVHNLFRKREDMNIQCYLPIDDILVFADREQLLRILNNLIKNAIQAIPLDRKGEITIRLNKSNGLAVISIEDNGIGIPEEMKSKIFEPNFTTKSSGTGLGLAMCRNMIEGFNGKIYFKSTPNKGTTFFVEIPMMRLEGNYMDENRVVLT